MLERLKFQNSEMIVNGAVVDGAPVCACLWPLLLGLGSGRWTQKAPALMTVWSAARGAGRLSKRGHSFCLRSLAGPIQPPTPRQHPLSAHFPLRERREGGGILLSPETEPPRRWANDRQGVPTGFKKTDLLSSIRFIKKNIDCIVRSRNMQKKPLQFPDQDVW